MTFLSRLTSLFLAAAIAASPALADLVPNIVGESTATLPRSRWMVSVTQVVGAMDERFNARGESEKFSSMFDRSISWNQVIEDRPERTEQLAGLLLANGIDPNSEAGRLNGDFQGRVTTTVPVLGYGISDRVGIFLAVPVLKFEARSQAGFLSSESTRRFLTELESNGQGSTAREFESGFDSSFERQLARRGYRFRDTTEDTYLGDLRFEIPYVILRPENALQLAWTQTVIAPTAERADPSDLFSFYGGQGRWALGSRMVAAWQIPSYRKLSLIGSLGGLVPFAASQPARIPAAGEGTQDLSADLDLAVRVSGGAQLQSYFGTRYQISRSFRADLSFQHQQASPKTFEGSSFAGDRYRVLGIDSAESLQSLQAMLEMNSIAAFLAGDFVMPGVLNLGGAFPLSGRNSLASASLMLQGSMFF